MNSKNIIFLLFSCIVFNSILADDFKNKFNSWWTWKAPKHSGKVIKQEPTPSNPEGSMDFVPSDSPKYSLHAYTHIKIDSLKNYMLTLKLKMTDKVNSKTSVRFIVMTKDKNKSWYKLKSLPQKNITIIPGETQTISLYINLPDSAAGEIAYLVPKVIVNNLKTGEIILKSLKCSQVDKTSTVKQINNSDIQKLSKTTSGSTLIDYKMLSSAMPKTQWIGGKSKVMKTVFKYMPLNVSIFKLTPITKSIGFQWPDKKIILLKYQNNTWTVYKGKSNNLEICFKTSTNDPELVFFGTGILLKKNGKMLGFTDYGVQNSNVHCIIPEKISNISFKNIKIFDAVLQWRFLSLAEKNLKYSQTLLNKNIKYILAAYRNKNWIIKRWEENFKLLKMQITQKRKSIISETGDFVPLLLKIQTIYDRYSTSVQCSGFMTTALGYLGNYYQQNWFKTSAGMPAYQYSENLKARCKRLVEYAWHLEEVAFQKGNTIKYNDKNFLTAGFTDSLATVFSNKVFTGNFQKNFTMTLCKGEYESCQLILRSGFNEINNIAVEINDITGPASIPASNCKIFLVRDVRLAEPYNVNIPPTGGGNTKWPDPLRPWDSGKSFSIPTQSNQVIWLTLKAPQNAIAGDYKLNLNLKTNDKVVATLTVKFKIFDFNIGSNRLLGASGMRLNGLHKLYGKNPETRRKFEKVLLDHYCNPIDIYVSSPEKEDLGYCLKNGLDLATVSRLENFAAPRKDMVKFVELYAGNGKTFKKIKAEVELVSQTVDKLSSDWNLQIKPESELKGFKYIKIHNPEKRTWENRCRYTYFWLDSSAESIVLNSNNNDKEAINNVKYYMLDKKPAIASSGKLIPDPGKFEFDNVRLNNGLASIVIEKNADTPLKKIIFKSCKKRIYIQKMQKVYDNFRKQGGKNLKLMCYGFDEAAECNNPEILSALKTIKKLFPDVLTVTTSIGIKDMPECYKYLDYIVPNNSRFYTKTEKELMDKYGTKSWLYVGGGAYYPYPNFERVDQPRINSRAFFWNCIRFNIKGWLYWAINMWRYNVNKNRQWPEIWDKWNPSWSYATNGMGALLYPGPDNTPIPSIRLEIMRDGIEDYNYFCIAEEMLKKKKFSSQAKQKEIADFVKKSKLTLSPGFTGFLEDSSKLKKIRNKLGSYIEQMNRLPNK